MLHRRSFIWLAYIAIPSINAFGEEPKKEPEPIVVSAQALAQAVQDDVSAAAKKYHLVPLQIDGSVSKPNEFKGKVSGFQIDLMVKDPRTKKEVSFTVFCVLKDSLASDDKRIDEFAKGKKVTVRGKSGAMGNGQVTMFGCTLVPTEKPKR